MLSYFKALIGKGNTQYKCYRDDCKYVSDKEEDCCGKPLVKVKAESGAKSGGCSCC